MNSKLEVNYHVDKLDLVYETTDWFKTPFFESVYVNFFVGPQPVAENHKFQSLWNVNARIVPMLDTFIQNLWNVNPIVIPLPKVFILENDTRRRGKYHLRTPNYEVWCYEDNKDYKVGTLMCHLEDAVILNVDNKCFYSSNLKVIYDFEKAFKLTFERIKNFDVCCDANQNLPKKLDDTMHLKNCEVTRPGQRKDKIPLTDKGNQVLGTKVLKNLKTLTEYERTMPSFYYELKNSGSKKPMILRGYNKREEIEKKSHKNYIQEANGFEGDFYRLEVSVTSYDLTKQSKNKTGWSHKEIYRNLHEKEFLKEFFISFLNRFYRLKIDGQPIKISKLLRLE